MAFSIYEVGGAQDVAKDPNKILEPPDYYLQDVFFVTRPDIYNFREEPGGGDPSMRNFRDDQAINDVEWSDSKFNLQPENWAKNEPILVNPYKRYDVKNLISSYRLANDPVVFTVDLPEWGNRTAVSFENLLRSTSAFSRRNAPRNNARLIKHDPKRGIWVYRVVSYMKNSDPRGHVVTIEMPKNTSTTKSVVDMRQVDIKVSCSCPFWKYWGPDYNADKGDYLEGKPYSNLQSPDIRDPKRENKICKHVYTIGVIFDRFAKKHNLDTFREVDQIMKELGLDDEEASRINFEDVKEVNKNLDRSDRMEIDKFIRQYEREKSDKRKQEIREETLDVLKDKLKDEEKGFLRKLVDRVKQISRNVTKKLFKKSSLDNVLSIYMNEMGDKENADL